MHLSDRVTGVFLSTLGALAAYGGSLLPPVPGQQIGPNVFPIVVGLGLVGCGALIALGVGRGFEDAAEADLAAHSDTPDSTPPAPAWWRGLMALLPPGLLLFYVYTVDRLGFLPAAGAMVCTAAIALGARLPLAIGMAIGAPLVVNLIFTRLLRVPLPSGLLPLPWLGLP